MLAPYLKEWILNRQKKGKFKILEDDRQPLRKELDANLKELVVDMGFKPSKYGFWRRKGDCIEHIDFGHASFQIKGHILLSCHAALGHTKIYEIYERFSEEESRRRTPVLCRMISCNIGYLMPKKSYHEWDVSRPVNYKVLCNDIRKSIIKYAYPYYERRLCPVHEISRSYY